MLLRRLFRSFSRYNDHFKWFASVMSGKPEEEITKGERTFYKRKLYEALYPLGEAR
jgi:hypothetical protein